MSDLVFLEEGAADVAVERVLEVLLQVLQSGVDDVTLLGVVDGHDEQLDEPGQRVLVHGLYVGQVRDHEEQNARVVRDRLVPCKTSNLTEYIL